MLRMFPWAALGILIGFYFMSRINPTELNRVIGWILVALVGLAVWWRWFHAQPADPAVGDSHGMGHVTMQTASGTDPNWQGGSQFGSLDDEHTWDRRRVWWTLSPYNVNRNTTTIYLVHILAGN